MWTILVLFLLWILSMQFYLPAAVVLILFAALVSGATVTISFALARRKSAAAAGAAAAAAVADASTAPEFLQQRR